MPAWQDYKTRPKLLDVTVTGLSANTSDFACPLSGSSSSGGNAAKVTIPGFDSLVPDGQAYDALLVVVTPAIQSQSSLPDARIWFDNGTASQKANQLFDVSYQANMLPPLSTIALNPEVIEQPLLLGLSTRDLLRKASVSRVSNLPLKITGYKATSSLTLHVASTAGWSDPLVPLRVRVFGDVLTAKDIADMARLPYDGSIALNLPPAAPFSARHAWINRELLSGWANGPGGPSQGDVRVNRRIRYAYNAQAATGLYVLSQKNGVRGQSTNIASPEHDLGEVLGNSRSAVLYDRIGCNLYSAGSQAYVSWQIDGTTVPQETPQGIFVTANENRLSYGAETTTGGDGSGFKTLGSAENLARILLHRNAAALAFQPVSGTLVANGISMAAAGVAVEVS